MNVRCAAVAMLALTPGLAACSNASFAAPAVPAGASAPNSRPDGSSPIKHIVIMIQENRSFDDFFATFPGADGTTTGYYLKKVNGKFVRTQVALTETTLGSLDFNHSWKDYVGDYDKGGMDGFNHEGFNGNNPAGLQPYQYVNPSAIQQYWTLAEQYALADEMFQTQGSGSFTAHQDLIAGTTHQVYNNHIGSLVDYPSGNGNWGCNAAASTTTSMLTKNKQYLQDEGPFPCLTYSTGTLRDQARRQARFVEILCAAAQEQHGRRPVERVRRRSTRSTTAPSGPPTFRCPRRTSSTTSRTQNLREFRGSFPTRSIPIIRI